MTESGAICMGGLELCGRGAGVGGIQGCVWLGHCTDRTNCTAWRSAAAQEQLPCCSCAVSAGRGDAGEVEREVHGALQRGTGWLLVMEFRLVSVHHITSWELSPGWGVQRRTWKSGMCNPPWWPHSVSCLCSQEQVMGHGTQWLGVNLLLLHWQLSARGLSRDIQCSVQEPFITFSALHLAATASQRALGRGNDLALRNGDLFPKVLYCNIFLLSDCTGEASHSYHAGSGWGSLILFF